MDDTPSGSDLPSSRAQDSPSGGDDLRAQRWRQHRPPGLMNTLGPLLGRGGAGGRSFGLQIDDRHLNPAGVAHGGTIAALLDQALSTIAWEANGRSPCFTVQLNVSFVSAARPGDTLEATGTITHQSGSLIFLDGTLHAGETLIATAQAIMKRMTSC
jgi:uncharacterized protein (TIGR00369 family)